MDEDGKKKERESDSELLSLKASQDPPVKISKGSWISGDPSSFRSGKAERRKTLEREITFRTTIGIGERELKEERGEERGERDVKGVREEKGEETAARLTKVRRAIGANDMAVRLRTLF